MNRLGIALEKHGRRPILGAAAYTYNPNFIEMAALMGYTAAWIEMEHTFITFAEAADLCRIASGFGMLTMIRIPDTRRETVLKAAECGPDIIDLPMANTPECLMIQIETKEAVERIDELCAVPGVDAIFLGPADLSASLGVPGQTGHPTVYAAAERTIRVARAHGKQVAVGAAPQDFPFWVGQDVDILYAVNDLTAMKQGAQLALLAAHAAISGKAIS